MIEEHKALDSLNSLALPAKARFFCALKQQADIAAAYQFAQQQALPVFFLGGGSNCVFSQDFAGLLLHMQLKGITCLEDTAQTVLLRAAAGEVWDEFLCYCLSQGYYGLENLALIPGTVGAAPIQNIGAYGAEAADCLEAVEAWDWQTGQAVQLDKAQCQLTYRDSLFKRQPNRYLICAVHWRLNKQFQANLSYQALASAIQGQTISAERLRQTVIALRQSRLPDPEQLPNAGSFFKNPIISQAQFAALKQQFTDLPSFAYGDEVKLPAAWLIEYCGFKGKRLGKVGMYEKQALVLVNYQQASFSELKALIDAVTQQVQQVFAIRLEPEPVFI